MLKISLIIATYNRAQLLDKTLASLLDQECDDSFCYEIIVVDNNSSDDTKLVTESYLNKFSNKLSYEFEGKQGKSHALNRGIELAQGDIIAFTDDDVDVDSKWLSSIAQCFLEFNCDCVGGRVLPVYPDNAPQWIQGEKERMGGIVVSYDYGEDTKEYDNLMDEFIGANYAFKREVFKECGMFRLDLGRGRIPVGEDREFINRLIKNKKKLMYCGSALIWHPVDLSRAKLRNVARWYIALGRSSARKEYESGDNGIVYSFGVPRYLIKGAFADVFIVLASLFNRKALFFSFRRLFRKVGMIMEYKVIFNRKTSKERSHAQG